MSDDLMSMFEELDRQTAKSKDAVLRSPFPYPGGKFKSLDKILPLLPYRNTYVEPFGGGGVVLLSRRPSPLEVFNDRCSGVTSFYRCIRNPELLDALCERLDLTIHSREEFVWCKETWNHITTDDVERAARWYYMINTSFASLGRNWGRVTKGPTAGFVGKIRNKLKYFTRVHERLRRVQIENQHWHDCLMDYDTEHTVFYIDPPYVDAHRGTYKHELSIEQHRELLECIFELDGFCAVSGYTNPLYENQDWDSRHEWETFVSIEPAAFTTSNHKEHLEGSQRVHTEEILWIKESR